MAARWRQDDGWFFASVMDAGPDDVGLQQVIAMGDALNHSIFTVAEIEGAVRRLTSAGLLEVDDLRFRLSEAGEAIRARIPADVWGYDRVKWIQRYLEEHIPCESESDWHLAPEAFKTAWEAYQAEFQRSLQEDRADEARLIEIIRSMGVRRIRKYPDMFELSIWTVEQLPAIAPDDPRTAEAVTIANKHYFLAKWSFERRSQQT